MHRYTFFVVVLSSLVAIGQANAEKRTASAKLTGAQIAQAVDERDIGKDQVSTMTLEIQPKKGSKRLRRLMMVRKNYSKTRKLVTFMMAPADLRNAAFMVWDKPNADDQRWLYLPAVDQLRRLAVRDARQKYFGSDFFYEDLSGRDPVLDIHKLVGSQKVDQWNCWVVDSVPKDADSVEFARIRSWVIKDSSVVLRAEFYDASGKVLRRYEVNQLEKVDGIWVPRQNTMVNLVTGSRSRVQVGEIRFNTGLSDNLFEEAQLRRGAPQLD